MISIITSTPSHQVTPRAGVWIEITATYDGVVPDIVTPRAGVWIEISTEGNDCELAVVTPRAGVWIEIR